jgi:glycine oxidase
VRVRGAVWPSNCSADDLAALSPGLPAGGLPPRPDVLVVGGGTVGLACAAMCVRAGLGQVVVVEADEVLAGAASGGAAAALTPAVHEWTDPPGFVALARSSLAWYRELDESWSGALGLRSLDWLVLTPVLPPASFDPGPGNAVLSVDEVVAMEPALAGAAADALLSGAIHLTGQAHVHPLGLAAALARRAGVVATGVRVTDLSVAGDRVVGVSTSSAGTLSPGAVVFATGLAPERWVKVPQRWVKGHLIATAPVPAGGVRLSVALASPWGLVVPLPDGHLVAGGTLDEGESGDLDPAVADGLASSLAALLPTAAGPVSHRWCCLRPSAADGQPVIDRVPGLANAWVNACHFRTGILMAPAAGHALAEWIATGAAAPPSSLAPFSASRFAPDAVT